MANLRLAPETPRRDPRPLWQPVDPRMAARDERVVSRGALGHRCERQAGDGCRRQVLQAMYRYVSTMIEQRVLNRLGEEPIAADLCQRAFLHAIALRLNDDELDGPA